MVAYRQTNLEPEILSILKTDKRSSAYENTPHHIRNSLVESKDPTYRRVRCSSQSIPNSHIRNSTDRLANSFKTYHNTIIIFHLSFHTSNTYFSLQAAYVTLNSNPGLLLGIYYKFYGRGDADQERSRRKSCGGPPRPS